MKNAIILHGMPGKDEYYSDKFPSASNFHWLPWLQKQLLVRDIAAHTPEMPNAWKPDYETWRKEFERYEITPETILVGHSCGGGFLVRWLSEHKDVKAGKVVLVAPWLDLEREYTTDFFEFKIDPSIAVRTAGLTVFNSDNDNDDIHQSVDALTNAIPGLQIREFHNYDHFNTAKTDQFSELLEELLP